MSAERPIMHHVVFAVAAERVDRATSFLESLGFRLQRHIIDDVGLQVLLDWERGVELVTPLDPTDVKPGSVAEFLASRGDGVYSVVIRVDDADAAVEIAQRHGASVEFRQDRTGDGLELVEVQLASLMGMPLTLLITNLP